jgi:hypothetical protein
MFSASLMIKPNKNSACRCDRILWHGEGIVQLCYIRGESKFSDHRPVCGVFIVEAAVPDNNRLVKFASGPNMKVGAEELLVASK